MKWIGILIAACCPFLSFAQSTTPTIILAERNEFLKDINGSPLNLTTGYEMDGSPFYKNEYCLATIKVARGKRYRGLDVKLDLQDNRVIYRLPNGLEQEASTPIESVEFAACDEKSAPATFRSGFPVVDRQDHRNFYQVLDSGKLQLLKFVKVTYMDQKPYGGASIIRKFDNAAVYYAYSPEKGMINLGKGNEKAIAVFGDQKSKAEKFIAEQNIRVKKETDLIKLFAFYNTSSGH